MILEESQSMKSSSLRLMLSLLVLSIPTFADTVSGTGGTSPAVSGFSGSSFEWIDNTGGVDASTLSSLFGYNVFQSGPGEPGSGSLLLSNPFTVGATSTLNVSFSIFTAENIGSSFNELGFAVLLQNSQLVAILGASRPDGINHIGDFGDFPTVTFQAPSGGVTTTSHTHLNGSDLPVMTLGSQQYGTLVDASNCFLNCLTDVTSSYTPGAGTYQILYGSFVYDGANHNAAGLAVKAVSVPEPTPLELAFVTLLLIGGLMLVRNLRLTPTKA